MKDWKLFEEEIKEIANYDLEVLVEKGKGYGDSWKARGGVGAFMMLARKWDRLENIAKQNNYDILKAALNDTHAVDGVMDDIADLRRYLLLVEHEVARIQLEEIAVENIKVGLND
jgi:hypothetical protein